MATGRGNKLTGQIAEHLVCAELGKCGLIATPFAGNVPQFDIVAADELCNTVPIQVKASNGDNWPTDARTWMRLTLDPQTGVQHYDGPLTLPDRNLIYVCVVVGSRASGRPDRFFVLTKGDIQQACIASYVAWMEPHGWRRPRNPASFDCRYAVDQLVGYENNWQLIRTRLSTNASQSRPSPSGSPGAQHG